MNTLRMWLTGEGFDWENGVILYQGVEEDCSPGWAYDDDLEETIQITDTHPILDEEFDSGFGSPQCPRIFAKDEMAIYFPTQYDGSTSLERVIINPKYYIGNTKATPYPGS